MSVISFIRIWCPRTYATGDLVTYHPVDFEYITLFLKENLNIKSYNLESMLAEKLETIYSKGFLNSRSKDFYDVHVLYRLKKSEINFDRLLIACERIFSHIATVLDFKKMKDLLVSFSEDKGFHNRWKAYAKKNTYVTESPFVDVIESIQLLINEIVKG